MTKEERERLEREYQEQLQLEIVPSYEEEMKEILQRERASIFPMNIKTEKTETEKPTYH